MEMLAKAVYSAVGMIHGQPMATGEEINITKQVKRPSVYAAWMELKIEL